MHASPKTKTWRKPTWLIVQSRHPPTVLIATGKPKDVHATFRGQGIYRAPGHLRNLDTLDAAELLTLIDTIIKRKTQDAKKR